MHFRGEVDENPMQIRGLLLTGFLVACAAGAYPAWAQQGSSEPDSPEPARHTPGIEERVVLAGESEGARDFEDLAKFTPNLEIVTAGATTATFFIRGVGLNDFNANGTGAVSIYQDDVALNAAALQLGTIFDLEAVNVQRGPQGTGAFRNASAGAIKLYSRKPSGGYGGYVRGQYGRFDYIDMEGAVEAPIYEDILSARFAFRSAARASRDSRPGLGECRHDPGGLGGCGSERRTRSGGPSASTPGSQ